MRTIEAGPGDAATDALLAAYFAERAAGFPGGGYRVVRPDAAAFVAPGVFLRLEEDDGTPLAIGGLRRVPSEDGLRLELKHLFVAPSARRRGLGRVLLERLEARARAVGAAELVLDTNRSLEAAGGLYASGGFLPVPAYNDNPNATDWYAKRLS